MSDTLKNKDFGSDVEWVAPAKPAEPSWWPRSKIAERPALPADSKLRKEMPITTGLLHYFPRAAAYVAKISRDNNEKHNPGQPMHWAEDRSNDHLDCCGRHLADAGTRDAKGTRETGYLAWRAFAALETELKAAEARGEPW